MRVISGKYRGSRLNAPKGNITRPTTDSTRESLFNILINKLDFDGVRVLDIFAGTGALGIEALSRGADFAIFVENHPDAQRILRQNLDNLSLNGNAKILKKDATRMGSLVYEEPFDIVFADPPYSKELGVRAAMSLVDGGWLRDDALFVLEEKRTHVPENLNGFERIDMRSFGSTAISIFQFLG